MAIVTMEDEQTVNTVVPVQNNYRTATMLNHEQPLDTLVQYIDGIKWSVEYFLQVLGEDDDIGPLDAAIPDSLAQYAKINGMVIYLDSAITQGSASNIEGTGYVNAGIIPNQGDVFRVTLVNNREALMRVENVAKQNYNHDTVYYITFKLDTFIETNSARYADLVSKTIRTFYYDRTHIETKSAPILLLDDYVTKMDFTEAIPTVSAYYFKTMIDSRNHLLTIPGQTFIITDSRLEEFVFRTVNTDDSPAISKITRVNSVDDRLSQPSILTAIANRDKGLLSVCTKQYCTVKAGALAIDPVLKPALFQGVEYIVYPYDSDDTISESTDLATDDEIAIDYVENPYNATNPIDAGIVHDYDFTSKYYILSEAFFNEDTVNMSELEKLVLQYLNKDILDINALKNLLDTYERWDRVEQFYYIPILLILLRDSVNSTYSPI